MNLGNVVYVSIPTSNHNIEGTSETRTIVVYVSIPTSNHNSVRIPDGVPLVVYVSIPTSNHNLDFFSLTYLQLYMSLFLHQTTTYKPCSALPLCCICLYSYIKPQPAHIVCEEVLCCICLYSYIKPQHAGGFLPSSLRCICLYSYIKPQHRLIIILYNKHLHALLLPKKWHLMWISFCKCTKKILTVKAPSAFFSFFPFPNSSQYHHIAYLSHSIYLPYLFLAQWL